MKPLLNIRFLLVTPVIGTRSRLETDLVDLKGQQGVIDLQLILSFEDLYLKVPKLRGYFSTSFLPDEYNSAHGSADRPLPWPGSRGKESEPEEDKVKQD